MWKLWRKRVRGTRVDADQRLAAANQALAENVEIAMKSSPIAAKSRELAQANSIAAILRDSLRVQPAHPERE